VAKTTSGFNSDRTIRQYAHGLLLESPFRGDSAICLGEAICANVYRRTNGRIPHDGIWLISIQE